MSTKTLRKRIALVAVAVLGFGLVSAVPASAGNVAVTDLTIQKKASAADASLSVSSAIGSALTRSYNIYTRNSTVAIGDLSLVITLGAAASTNTNHEAITIAAGTRLAVGSTAATAFVQTAALTAGSATAIADATGTDPFATFTASAAGTVYTLWNDGIVASSGATNTPDQKYQTTEASIQITLFKTSASAVTATLDTPTTTLAGRTNQQVTITPRGDLTTLTVGSSSHPVLRVAAAITSQPSGSLVYPNLSAIVPADTDLRFADTGITVGTTAAAVTTGSTGSASAVATVNYSGYGDTVVSGSDANLGTITFTPTHAGTYSVTVWNESDTSAAASLSGSESYQVFTVNVSAGVTTVSLTAINSTAAKSGANGSLVKVSLKDAAGNAAILAPGETVTLTPSGSGDIATVNGTTVTSAAGAAYNLSAINFNTSGVAWINLVDTVAETVSLTAGINGGTLASKSITFKAVVSVTSDLAVDNTSGFTDDGAGAITVPLGTVSLDWAQSASAGSSVSFTVTEELVSGVGAITGYTTALSYDEAATVATGGTAAYITVTATSATAVAEYKIATDATTNAASGTESIVTGATNAADSLSVSPSNVNAVLGSTNSITATLSDVFGNPYPNQTVTVTVAGKNPTTVGVTKVTDANGKVTFSLTDANTNTAVNDVVTFAVSGITSKTSTISYGTNAVSTLTLTYPGKTDLVAGTTTTDINAAAAGATGTTAAVSVVAKNAAGALLAGVPVTFAVSGLTGAEVLTTLVTVYTDTTGTAATSVASYAAGKATVTATGGGISASGDIYFAQATATEARTITAKANGSVVTATVKDRYGNPVAGAYVWATRTGSAYFGTGASTSKGATDKNGTIDFIIGGGAGTVTVQLGGSTAASATYGQSADAAGYVGGNATTGTEIDAYVAGDANDDQTGLGGTFTAAGVNSASVAVDVANVAADNAQAATDAAAEATDAANAATDAANAAAEAAEAATAAAQDAADAVAALSASVTEMVNALKKQVTSLTALVIKIQKKLKA